MELLVLVVVAAAAGRALSEPARFQPVVIPNSSNRCPTQDQTEAVLEMIRNEVRDSLRECTDCTDSTSSPTSATDASPTPSGYRRVAYLNTTDPNQPCPRGLDLIEYPLRLCGITRAAGYSQCVSTFISVSGAPYTTISGRIIGFQNGTTYGFYGGSGSQRNNISASYLDGVSLTLGNSTHRRHVWSFATGYNQLNRASVLYNCPQYASGSPWFVDRDFFCESGNNNSTEERWVYYTGNPLWDGNGCIAPANTYCHLNNPPWFTKTFRTPTDEDIELRVCRYHTFTEIGLQSIEIYVQ